MKRLVSNVFVIFGLGLFLVGLVLFDGDIAGLIVTFLLGLVFVLFGIDNWKER